MRNPILSIIIPVFNSEEHLQQCIDSVINQSFRDYELIIIDDGSQDDSGLICNKYAEKDCRIKVIHQKNQGVSSARNVGIESASGEWITFVDSDDYLAENYLDIDYSLSVDLILQKKTVIGQEDLEETYPIGLYEGSSLRQFLSLYMTGALFRVPWGKFFKTSVIKDGNIRFPRKYKFG